MPASESRPPYKRFMIANPSKPNSMLNRESYKGDNKERDDLLIGDYRTQSHNEDGRPYHEHFWMQQSELVEFSRMMDVKRGWTCQRTGMPRVSGIVFYSEIANGGT